MVLGYTQADLVEVEEALKHRPKFYNVNKVGYARRGSLTYSCCLGYGTWHRAATLWGTRSDRLRTGMVA